MDDKTKEKRLEKDHKKKIKKNKTKNKEISSESHIIRKRTPFQFPKTKKDIYINKKTNFKAYLRICEKILDSDEKEVVIHALGSAITRACTLALRLQEIHHDTLELDIKTTLVHLTDDLEPVNDDADYEVKERVNSAIHIRVFPKAAIGPLRFDESSNSKTKS